MLAAEHFSKKALHMDILEFFKCKWVLNVDFLSPVQVVILKSIMGMELDTETPIELDHEYQFSEGPFARAMAFENEVELYKWFTGKDEYKKAYYEDVDLCIGRRSGKSTLLGAGLAIYFATQYNYEPYLRTSPHATIPIISPTKDQAGEVYSSIKQMLIRSPYLFQTFLDGKIDGFADEYSEENIGAKAKLTGGQIKLNNNVIIKVMAADMGKMRGMAVPFGILDECCFFGVEGKDNKNTDRSIYEALSPALSQFQEVEGMAMILKISSPNGQSGLMYENYEKRKDPDVLHWQVPSWYANTNIPIRYLKKQKKKGQSFFNREYGAQYTASEQAYLDPILIDESVIKGVQEMEPMKGYKYVAVMDYATKEDYWAFGIGHKEYITDPESKEKVERIYIDFVTHWRGKSGEELDPKEVIPQICAHMKKYKVSQCYTDQYAYAALRSYFQREGCILKEFPISTQSKLKYMFSLQIAINSGSFKMVANPIAIKHLKDLREKRSLSTNKLRIEHAQNCHDDYADVIGLIVYQFDKTSPIYVGTHREEEEPEVKTTKDARGQHLAYPTAEEMAEHVGVPNFYDNRKEEDAKKKEDEDPDDDGGGFFFIV